MDLTKLAGYDEVRHAVERNTTPRSAFLETLERYVDGTQYDGLPDWFSTDKPLWERAPCIVYPLTRTAIDSNTDLVLGEGRFPAITSRPDEDDAEYDSAAGLNEDDSATLDHFIEQVARQTRFRASCREVFGAAQGCGSGVAIMGTRDDRLFVDTTRARWCTPTLDSGGNCTRLEIQYPYVETYREQNGKVRLRARLYRRVIDEQRDVTYLPAEASQSGVQPSWQEDPRQVFDHHLGFCPVRWYALMRGCSVVNDFDGRAIHAHLLDEIRALDFALSQRHRAAIYAGDPQWTEAGVEPGYVPTAVGAVTSVPGTPKGGMPVAGSNEITTRFVDQTGATKKGRRKSPGDVWQYANPNTKVQLHTLPGDALEALDKHAIDLRMKLAESLGVVFIDPEAMKGIRGGLSGRALEALKQRQLDRCDQYRLDFGDGFILPSVNLLLRIVHTRTAAGAKLRIPALGKAAPILRRFEVPDGVAAA